MEKQLLDRIASLESMQQTTASQARRWQWTAVLLALVGLLCVLPRAGGADSQAGGLPALAKRVDALEATTASQATQLAALNTALANEAAARQAADAALQASLNAESATRATADASLQGQIDPLAAKLSHFSIQMVDGHYTVVLASANLQLTNGLGATNGNPSNPYLDGTGVVNGLGNLIIGYNEIGGATDNRSGSHNLILGQRQNYTRFGGLVAGAGNTISGPYASVTGGTLNIASGNVATVGGGARNEADGIGAAVSGGWENEAKGLYASVTGGIFNRATGAYSSVSGGKLRSAGGQFNWAAGGLFQNN